MKKRRRAREKAMQILYQKDITRDRTAQIPQEFWEGDPFDPETKEFALRIVHGALENLEKIDSLIEENSDHWGIHRMGVVDRNILRMAVYEMTSDLNVPPKVVLNEAIEIAKKFGDEESSKFINGVLDKIKKEISP